MSAAAYFLWIGKQRGPYTLEQIEKMFADHVISAEELYWTDGMEQWKTIRELLAKKKGWYHGSFLNLLWSKRKSALIITGLLAIYILCLIIWFSIASSLNEKTTSKASPDTVEVEKQEAVTQSKWDGSVIQVVRYLKHNARDPESVKCSDWSNIKKTGDNYLVACTVRAKNGFGGYQMIRAAFLLDPSGTVLTMQKLEE